MSFELAPVTIVVSAIVCIVALVIYYYCYCITCEYFRDIPENKRITNLTVRRIVYITLMVLAPLTALGLLIGLIAKKIAEQVRIWAQRVAEYTHMDK